MGKIEIDEKTLIQILQLLEKHGENSSLQKELKQYLGDALKVPEKVTLGDTLKAYLENRTTLELELLEKKMPVSEQFKSFGLFIGFFLFLVPSFIVLLAGKAEENTGIALFMLIVGIVLVAPGLESIFKAFSKPKESDNLEKEQDQISELKKKIEAMQDELKACKK